MINWRRKDFNNPPAVLANAHRLAALREAENLIDGDQIKSSHYNFDLATNLLKAYSLDQDTFNENTELAKCYYCESTSEVVASLQVEHYRPKKRVDDNARQVVPGTFGYYWLGIEWSNLVLACSKCNGRGAKGNIFTITGNRVYNGTTFDDTGQYDRTRCIANQQPLINEIPDLLHPEIDDSYAFLEFDWEGKIAGKSHRGRRTIEICKLDRKQLNIARNDLINRFNDSFWEVVAWHAENIITEDQLLHIFKKKCIKLRERYNRKQPYTLLARYMIENFEVFFVNRIPNEYKDTLREAFRISA